MPKKQGSKGKEKRRVHSDLPGWLVSRVDRAARSSGESRAAVIRRVLEAEFGSSGGAKGYDELVAEADVLRRRAASEAASGHQAKSAATCLLAAAKELEAASRLSPSTVPEDETRLKSALLLAVQLTKRGSGYSRLPETPDPAPSSVVQ